MHNLELSQGYWAFYIQVTWFRHTVLLVLPRKVLKLAVILLE